MTSLRRWFWLAIALMSAAYAPFAVNAIWRVVMPGGRLFIAEVMAALVSSDFAYGPHSGTVVTLAPNMQSPVSIGIHTVLGGLLMLAGPPQFSTRLRRWRPRLHRQIGMAYFCLVAVCMATAAIYLLSTSPTQILSGPVFAAVLWSLVFAVSGAALQAWVAIRNGNVAEHARFMALSYGLLLSAPFLRVDWVVMAWLAPGTHWEAANLLAVCHLGALLTLGATAAARGLDPRDTAPGVVLPAPPGFWLSALGASSMAAISWLAHESNGEVWRAALSYVLPLAASTLAVSLALRSSRRAERTLSSIEWSTHLTAMLWAPPISLAIYLSLRGWMEESTAMYCAAVFPWSALQMVACTVAARRLRPRTGADPSGSIRLSGYGPVAEERHQRRHVPREI